MLALAGASQATAAAGSTSPTTAPSSGTGSTGGAGVGAPTLTPTPGPGTPSTPAQPTVPGVTAKIIHGVAYAPSNAPIQVQRAIWAGNQIRLKPYLYAGGHGVWNDVGYDCSGAVSYVLHGAGLLKTSMDSSGFESWGHSGTGQWITVYTNPAHAFVQIAGIRFDTSAAGDPHPAPGTGPRWRSVMRGTSGFQSRHPANL